MARIDGIYRDPPMVRTLETQHSKAEKELRTYTRKMLIRAPIFVLVLPLLTWSLNVTPVLVLTSALFYILCLRYIKKTVYLGEINGVNFYQTNTGREPNMEGIYNATLAVCEMRGRIIAVSHILEVYNKCVIFFVALKLIITLITFFIGGK